jgi:branched-chain amino acid transport system ATP-binding protein
MHRALQIIRDEHRSLSAVLHALRHVTDEYAIKGGRPDFKLLWAMVDYIERFPERLHHPKEDEYLYRLLRLRAPDARATLDALSAEHVEGARKIARLREVLDHLEAGRVNTRDFADLAKDYGDFHWRHMRVEEDAILPLAERALTAADWIEINAAFEANDDPLSGVDAKTSFDALFSRIVAMTPEPYGLGPPATPQNP